jgi:DNA-binding transcriptional ArsR family regulator
VEHCHVRSWRIPAVERSPKIFPVVSAVGGIATIRDRVIFGNSRAQGLRGKKEHRTLIVQGFIAGLIILDLLLEALRLAFVIYIYYSRYMDDIETIAALAALAQTTRLDTFRLLVAREPEGVPAGELARLMAVPQNTMSAHLSILARASLVSGERRGRSIIYRANLARLRELVSFLLKDCCGGRPEICAPLIAEISPCCADAEEQDHD